MAIFQQSHFQLQFFSSTIRRLLGRREKNEQKDEVAQNEADKKEEEEEEEEEETFRIVRFSPCSPRACVPTCVS